MLKRPNYRLLYTIFSAAAILIGTFLAISYAKGQYRITQKGVLKNTGLLSANSSPTAAEVYINNKLTSATDDTIYLEPGDYEVLIKKDGYSPWKKNLQIETGLVTPTNAKLFPIAPSLTPLTFTGIENFSPSPDGEKIIYLVASASASSKNGFYLMDLTNNPLSWQKGGRQITDYDPDLDLESGKFIWSPNSSEAVLVLRNKQVLLNLDRKNSLGSLSDLGSKKKRLLSEWEEDIYLREREYLSKFPPEIIKIATASAKNVYFSPNQKRLLYTATQAVNIPTGIAPPVPATNTQPENRQLEIGGVYVYDREEDKNFQIGRDSVSLETAGKLLLAHDLFNKQALSLTASPSAFTTLQASTSAQTVINFQNYYSPLFTQTPQWLADSRHLVYLSENNIKVMEYDGTNDNIVYAGPLAQNFIYPWSDGSRIVILTAFSPGSPLNLYAVELE